MKIWILLGVLNIFKVSLVCAIEEGNRKFEKQHFTTHLLKITENLQNFSSSHNNTNNAKPVAKNAILIIVEESQSEDAWRNFKQNHSFPIQGFLSSCKESHESNNSLSLNDDKHCQCQKLLKKNINELMTWAQLIKEMNTAIISQNDSIILPSLLNDGNSVHDHEVLRRNKRNRNEPTLFQLKRQSENSWHLNNINNQSTSTSSVLNTNSSSNRSNVYDAFWNFISTISQMHSLIFKTIFKLIGKHFSHNRISSQQKPLLPVRSSRFIDLISNTLMDLKFTSNKGFLLIAVTHGDQLSTILQMVESQVPFNETLMIVTGECSKDKRAIPYYASGLKPRLLSNTNTVFELPMVLKSTLAGCHGICGNKTFPLIISNKDGLKNRKKRYGNDDETQQDDEKAEESDADSNGNEDLGDNEDSSNSDHDPSDLDLGKVNSSTSYRFASSLVFKLILTIVIMIITY